MIITEHGVSFVQDYVNAVNECTKKLGNRPGLTALQCAWLRFVLLGLLLTNSLCWARFERCGLGRYSTAALSWLFRRAKIAWETLLSASICHIVNQYGIKSGKLVIDDSDHSRSKNTTQIAMVHKIKDKRTGGYCNGQNIVFLVLVSGELTIPVGFRFFEPDPALQEWEAEYKRLRAKGVAKHYLPEKPSRDTRYPKRWELGLEMVEEFTARHPGVRITAVAADAAYGNKDFMERAQQLISKPQAISQISKTQLIMVNGRYVQVGKFFQNYQGTQAELELRHDTKVLRYRSGKFKVKAHGKKLWVIALKYDGESEYRYLIATDMTWNDVDVIKAYATRWLVEVFIQDWKSYEGWAQLAKQRGIEGSNHGVILSLLCDHMLYFHDANLVSFKKNQRAVTVGSLRDKILLESLMAFVESIVKGDNPKEMLAEFAEKAAALFELRESKKHLRNAVGSDLSAEGVA